MELERTTLRSRVVRSTDCASQVPLILCIFGSLWKSIWDFTWCNALADCFRMISLPCPKESALWYVTLGLLDLWRSHAQSIGSVENHEIGKDINLLDKMTLAGNSLPAPLLLWWWDGLLLERHWARYYNILTHKIFTKTTLSQTSLDRLSMWLSWCGAATC